MGRPLMGRPLMGQLLMGQLLMDQARVFAGGAVRRAAAAWRYLREVSGDDAYERYLAHHAALHADEPPMTRQAYFIDSQRRKWSGVKRCC